MSLLKKIKDDSIQALKDKDKDKRLVLSTLIGMVEGKEPNVIEGGIKTHSDAQVISQIKSIVSGNIETGNIGENKYYEAYMPKELSDDELYDEIKSYIKNNELSGMRDMGKVMNHLKTNHGGAYNGKVASDIAKSML